MKGQEQVHLTQINVSGKDDIRTRRVTAGVGMRDFILFLLNLSGLALLIIKSGPRDQAFSWTARPEAELASVFARQAEPARAGILREAWPPHLSTPLI